MVHKISEVLKYLVMWFFILALNNGLAMTRYLARLV